MQSRRDALPVNMHVHRIILALVIVIAENGPSLDIHVMPDDAVTHEVEMRNSTAFKQHAGLHLTADAHLCSRSQEDPATQIGVTAYKAVCRDDRWGFDSHVVTDDCRLVNGYSMIADW